MPIRHDLKLIFIHIPRTSGTKFEKLILDLKLLRWPKCYINYLWGFSKYMILDSPYRCKNNSFFTLQHLTYTEIQSFFNNFINEYPSIKAYKTVTIIRNPYDRVLSLYKYKYGNKNSLSFIEFLNQIESILNSPPAKHGEGNSKYFYLSQYDYLVNSNKTIDIDHIIRYEDFPDNFKFIHNKLENKKSYFRDIYHKDNNTLLTDEVKNKIYQIYKKDFIHFYSDYAP